MFPTKLKTVAVVLLIVAALSGASGVIYRTQAAEQPKPERATAKDDKEKQHQQLDEKQRQQFDEFIQLLLQLPAAGDQKRKAVKWEYKAISPNRIEKLAPKKSKDKLTDGLNTLGDQGWELVAVQPGPTAAGLSTTGSVTGGSMPSTYVFKRPK